MVVGSHRIAKLQIAKYYLENKIWNRTGIHSSNVVSALCSRVGQLLWSRETMSKTKAGSVYLFILWSQVSAFGKPQRKLRHRVKPAVRQSVNYRSESDKFEKELRVTYIKDSNLVNIHSEYVFAMHVTNKRIERILESYFHISLKRERHLARRTVATATGGVIQVFASMWGVTISDW